MIKRGLTRISTPMVHYLISCQVSSWSYAVLFFPPFEFFCPCGRPHGSCHFYTALVFSCSHPFHFLSLLVRLINVQPLSVIFAQCMYITHPISLSCFNKLKRHKQRYFAFKFGLATECPEKSSNGDQEILSPIYSWLPLDLWK